MSLVVTMPFIWGWWWLNSLNFFQTVGSAGGLSFFFFGSDAKKNVIEFYLSRHPTPECL